MGDISDSVAIFRLISSLIGLGILSLPYAFVTGGWCLGLVLIVGIGAACSYTAFMLGECLRAVAKSERSLQGVVEATYGSRWSRCFLLFFHLNSFLGLVSFTITLDSSIAMFFDFLDVNHRIITIVAISISSFTLWIRDLPSLPYIQRLEMVMTILLILAVIFLSTIADLIGVMPIFQPRAIPSILGLFMFPYAGHFSFPEVYNEMRDPSRFKTVSIVSFSVASSVYMCFAVLGAKIFGSYIDEQITTNLPRGPWITRTALLGVAIVPLTKYPLQFDPIGSHVEQLLTRMDSPTTRLIRGLLGTFLLAVVTMFALLFPFFGDILNIAGSLCGTVICIITPSACYIKIHGAQLSRYVYAFTIVLTVFGSFICIVGTIGSMISLLQNI